MKYLTQDEQKALLRTVKEVKGAERDYVIMEMLLNTGLRASELCAVNVGDVRNKARLYVQPAVMKYGRGRFVPLNVRIQDILRKWIGHKMAGRHENIEDAAPLFVTRSGRRLSRQDLTQSIVEKWMVRAGMTTTKDGESVALYATHSLRHTFAKRWMDKGGRLSTLQKIMGHKTLAATGIYLEATDQEMEEDAHLLTIGPTRAERMAEAL